MVQNKSGYMDDETWVKVLKLVSSGIRKINLINVACVFPILFSVNLTLRIFPSKLSSDDLLFPRVVVIPHI